MRGYEDLSLSSMAARRARHCCYFPDVYGGALRRQKGGWPSETDASTEDNELTAALLFAARFAVAGHSALAAMHCGVMSSMDWRTNPAIAQQAASITRAWRVSPCADTAPHTPPTSQIHPPKRAPRLMAGPTTAVAPKPLDRHQEKSGGPLRPPAFFTLRLGRA